MIRRELPDRSPQLGPYWVWGVGGPYIRIGGASSLL